MQQITWHWRPTVEFHLRRKIRPALQSLENEQYKCHLYCLFGGAYDEGGILQWVFSVTYSLLQWAVGLQQAAAAT